MHRFIRTEHLTYEQRMAFVEEAERQGCRLRFAPAENVVVLHGTKRRAYLFYVAWKPEPKTTRQTRTLWPVPFPKSWETNGIPTRVVARPVRNPQRLIDALKIGD